MSPSQTFSSAFRAGAPRVPSHRCFRVLFIVLPGITESHCMRYRAFNVMEALRSVGVETDLLAADSFPSASMRSSPSISSCWSAAAGHRDRVARSNSRNDTAFPSICDLDDYLFDEEVIAHSEYLRQQPIEVARSVINQFRDLVLKCRYYTGSTSYLTERAAVAGCAQPPNSQRPERNPDRIVADRP